MARNSCLSEKVSSSTRSRAMRMQGMTGGHGGNGHVMQNALVLGAWQRGEEPIV
jgi:riboflavin synthase alpha subunit